MLRFAVWSLFVVSSAVAVEPGAFAYQRPGTPEVGGVRHMCLIYHGNKGRVAWTSEAILPYVAYVNEKGEPTDWMFDSFLFLEFANDKGTWLHHYREGKAQATAADWAWLADCWFREQTGLIGLEQAIEKAGAALKQRDHVVNVAITLPVPLRQVKAFGPLAGREGTLDFSKEADRVAALAWYIDRVLEQWRKHNYRHLRLVGFYWTDETISGENCGLVSATAGLVHAKGYKLYWIPYFGAAGVSQWRACGIDATMFQPNHFFSKELHRSRLVAAARTALAAGCGVEIEFDGRAVTSPEYRERFWQYLDAGVEYGWMKDSLLGYYEGGDMVGRFARAKDKPVREMYDGLYRFLKGTYRSRGSLGPAGMRVIRIDQREDLALASKGAKITGCARPKDKPAVAPEKIIDGQTSHYTFGTEYGYFAIPGALTIELPTTQTVSLVQVLLFELDGRTFRYRVETSVDNQTWAPAVDKSQGEWCGWQADAFTPRSARYVRLTGLHNSANTNFQVVEFEVYGPTTATSRATTK